MSDFHAIGGVSLTLERLLTDRMEIPVELTSVPVTIGPPPFSSKDNDPRKEEPRVNLFLYRVTENGNLQNQEIPGRGSPGAYGHPPLSLNLHYLVTAYGNVELTVGVPPVTLYDDTTAQFLLGSAMRVLHDVPMVTEQVITLRPPSGRIVLHENLRDEYERVKLTLEPLTLEDVTKVWTALALRFRLSAAYVVNVVQIESRRPRRFPRPVGKPASPVTPPLPGAPPSPGPMIYALTIQTPTIAEARVRRAGETAEQPFPYARIGDTLVLAGTSLGGPIVRVAFGDLVVPSTVAAGDRVEAVIPDLTIPGSGPIPPELQLQPGARTVRVLVSDPLVPQSVFDSNEAVFMLVPTVSPAIGYSALPTRRLTIGGARLVGPARGGETMIGRSAVPRDRYLSAAPVSIGVPVPDTLPTQGVHAVVGAPLLPSIALGPDAQTLDINIGGTVRTVTAHLTSPVALETVASILQGLIHDAGVLPPPAAPDRGFTEARVDLWHDQLVIVPGGLTDTIGITSPGLLTFAKELGLAAPQPPGATSAYVSGELGSPPPLSALVPRVRLAVGAQPPVTVPVPKTTSLAALADALQAKINAAAPAVEYAGAVVAVTGSQLLVIPGAAGVVVFDAPSGDDATVVELQLHAKFPVRVRVNGAESIDPVTVELPQ
jgi:hypothetical protein